jgi:hypothetical protein
MGERVKKEEVEAAARALHQEGLNHNWWGNYKKSYDELAATDPIGKNEFDGILERVLVTAADQRPTPWKHPLSDPVDHAISRLFERRTFRFGDRNLVVACLLHARDWRPLKAPWWTKKEACIIGADLKGNFFLSHCDGSVRYWDHGTQTDTMIARGVREFLTKLVE